MYYRIYKLTFPAGVHFGNNSLENSEATMHADTIFSALCHEAVGQSKEVLDELVGAVENGDILFSDALPFIGDMLYLPKPYISIHSDSGDSKEKKKFKKLEYIPSELYQTFLDGKFPINEHGDDLDELGSHMVKTAVSVRGEEEPQPYRVGSFWFNEGCGLYIIAGFSDEDREYFFMDLIDALSYDGIGGERSSGYGRFECRQAKTIPEELERALNGEHQRYVTLSVSLPSDDELENAVSGSHYRLVRRSGFVASGKYSDTQLRKNDLYVFDCGSVFRNRFRGQIADVSSGGTHPVYRYAKPLFIGVDV